MLFLKMFTDVSFRGLGGTTKSSWKMLQASIKVQKESLEEDNKGHLDEKTHHVRLAFELVDACLKRDPLDRWVVASQLP